MSPHSPPVTRRFVKPFGQTRGAQPAGWSARRSYLRTGIDDASTGLIHLGAREYDQSAGRFLSVDPVIDPSDPLQINGYAYADNNPGTKSDPDGLQPIECWEGTAVCRGRRVIRMKRQRTSSRNTPDPAHGERPPGLLRRPGRSHTPWAHRRTTTRRRSPSTTCTRQPRWRDSRPIRRACVSLQPRRPQPRRRLRRPEQAAAAGP
ncbi:RHS repeat-associated core domain-containing protein [Streptomyces sp. NPDC046727]|uniref:RHS repeat-associated core domain-containing protein n=1 Tax=Streptomyces sp. NPDC046727 TaxID=3155373 RepID=UPI0033C9658E